MHSTRSARAGPIGLTSGRRGVAPSNRSSHESGLDSSILRLSALLRQSQGALGRWPLRANLWPDEDVSRRHGEAEPGRDVPDRSRRLTHTGARDAHALGEWLALREHPPRAACFSSAVRAAETAEHVLRALGIAESAQRSDELYLASASRLRSLLPLLASTAEPQLVIGHNPGMAELAMGLARTGDPAALRRLASRFPPTACVEIELPEPVRGGGPGAGGELIAYWTPAFVVEDDR